MVRIVIEHGVSSLTSAGNQHALVAHTGGLTLDGEFVREGTILAEGDDILVTKNYVTVTGGPKDKRKSVSFRIAD